MSDAKNTAPARFTISRAASDDEKIAGDSPFVALLREIILRARDAGASDIHLQPTISGLDVRLRILGELETYKHLESQHRQAFIGEVKRVANFSLGVAGVPQDSSLHFEGWQLKLRASLLPSQYGEKIVFRLLDLSKKFDLGVQGFTPSEQNALEAALRFENGLILISGPTGSGKTTTLYSLLCALDRHKRSVITLEDPVEYEIEGLTQTEVSESLSFSKALRATLRQDPDVILVGEIRDEETAKLCIAAASTGHLVLSTLHANSAMEACARLKTLGVEEGTLGSLLRLSAAQRLVPRLCAKCSVVPLVGVGTIAMVDGDYRVRNERGCGACRGGIAGLVPILEYVTGPNAAQAMDTRLLRDSFLERAKKGEVDVREVEVF